VRKRRSAKQKSRAEALLKNERIPSDRFVCDFDRDSGDFKRLLGEVLPRLGPRGSTGFFVRLIANTKVIGYRGVLPLQFRNPASEYLAGRYPSQPYKIAKALMALVFSPMFRLHSGT
jgi:hypothetical protein